MLYPILRSIVEGSQILVDDNHEFLVSPETYKVGREELQELRTLGPDLQKCLTGISRIAAIAGNAQLYDRQSAFAWVNRALWSGIPKAFRDYYDIRPSATTSIVKVDLVPTVEGRHMIVEIDGYNERAMGYSLLTRRLRNSVDPNPSPLPGAAELLAAEIKQRCRMVPEAVLVYANVERFYLPEFQILAREVATRGATLRVASELEVNFSGDRLLVGNGDVPYEAIVYLPMFCHEKEYLHDWFMTAYKEKRTTFLIPPKPYFGSKAVLALLRNDEGDEQLESILQTFIPYDSLTRVRDRIPPTQILRRGANTIGKYAGKKHLLKKSYSSGAKGVYFSDSNSYKNALDVALSGDSTHVLQEEVPPAPQRIRYYPKGSETAEAAECFVRVTAHFIGTQGGLADLTITATSEKLVHGGTKSILMGTSVLD